MIRIDKRLEKPTKKQLAVVEDQKKVFTYLVATAIAQNDRVLPHREIDVERIHVSDRELFYNTSCEQMINLVRTRVEEAKAA
jgi:hypothetical protein